MQGFRTDSAEQPQLRRRVRREKVPQACSECRSRKIKCDGERPVCGPCLKRHGREAVCNLHLNTSQELAFFREEIARLNDKLLNLESGRDDDFVSNDVQDRHRNRTSTTRSEPESSSSSIQEDVDPMVGEICHPSPAGQMFFGTSSASGFVRQVQHALDPEHSTIVSPPTTSLVSKQQPIDQYQGSNDNFKPGTIDLPPRSTADHLLDIYWSITYPLYPFVDREETENGYLDLWQVDTSITVKRSFLCQINMIFAMAAQLDERSAPETRVAISRVYLLRGKRQLTSELWEHASLQSVQNFLILGQYLQSTTKGYQCWMVIGHAIRMAQNLGLHFRETSERIKSPRTQQLYRKVWHGCIMMDRVVSLTFGRPTMIDGQIASTVPMPLSLDDSHLTQNGLAVATEDHHPPMMIDFFIESLKLYEILYEILAKLYHSNEEMQSSSSLSTLPLDSEKLAVLLDLDQNLTTWFENLPAHLRTDENQSFDLVFTRQANILFSRYQHVRILLYRPSLARFITYRDMVHSDRATTQTTLYEALLLRSSSLCVQAALSAIEAVEIHLPESVASVGLLPAWWYNILYVYTAAIVLLAAARCPALQSEVNQESIFARFERAVMIVRRYAVYSSTVQRSIAALEALFAKIPDREGATHSVEGDESAGRHRNWSIPTACTDRFQAPIVPQTEQYEWPPQQNFRRPFGQPQTRDASMSSAYDTTLLPSYTIDQQADASMSMDLNPVDLNIPFDMNDFSWLNSLPFND